MRAPRARRASRSSLRSASWRAAPRSAVAGPLDAAAASGACSRATSGRATPCSLRSAAPSRWSTPGRSPSRSTRASTASAIDARRPARADALRPRPRRRSRGGRRARRHRAARPARDRRGPRASSRARRRGGARSVDARAGLQRDARRGAVARRCGRRAASRAFRERQRRERRPRHPRRRNPAHAPARRSVGVAAARARAHPATSRPPYAVVKVAHHGSADQDAGALRGARGPRSPSSPWAPTTTTAIRATRPSAMLDGVGARDRAHRREGLIARLAAAAGSRCGASERRRDRRGAVGPAVGWTHGHERAHAPRRGKARSAIPQVSWRSPQPAPIVLVSGPGRGLRRARDRRRARVPARRGRRASRCPICAPTTTTPGSLLARHLAFAVRRAAARARLRRREVLRRVPLRGARRTCSIRRRARPSSSGTPARACAARSCSTPIRAGEGGGSRSRARRSSATPTASTSPRASSRRRGSASRRPPCARWSSAFADDLTELAAACQQLIADVTGDITEQVVERYYGGRVETSAFAVADTAIAGRYGEALIALRHALASGADPVPLVAAVASKLRTMARVAGTPGVLRRARRAARA